MIKIENDCVGCPIPCTDCGARRTLHYYCDRCGDENKLYRYEGEELCEECLLDEFAVVEGSC